MYQFFSTISSGNLSQSLITIAGVSSRVWLFCLFSIAFSFRGWLFWTISLNRIFDTIITSLINFVLSEILMFIDTIEISKKASVTPFYTFFSCLSFLWFNAKHPCSMLPNLFYIQNLFYTKFPNFFKLLRLFSQQYLSTDVDTIWWSSYCFF